MGTVSQDVLQKHYYCRNNPLSADMCGGLPQWCPILYRKTRTWTKQGCRKSLCHKHWRKLMGGDCTYQPQRTCNQCIISRPMGWNSTSLSEPGKLRDSQQPVEQRFHLLHLQGDGSDETYVQWILFMTTAVIQEFSFKSWIS